MPSEGHGVSLWSGGEPQREAADGDAADVRQQVRCVRHDGQTLSEVST